MPIVITQKHVLLCPDISTWGVAYAMCVSSFYEAPFTMASLVAHIIACFIFAHNTLSGALIRLDVKNHTFWYRVVVGFLSVTVIVVMAIYWDIMPHWISSSYCADKLSPSPTRPWAEFFSFQPANAQICAQHSQVLISQALGDASIKHSHICANLDAAINEAVRSNQITRAQTLIQQSEICRSTQALWEQVRSTASVAHANTNYSMVPGQSTEHVRHAVSKASADVLEPVAKAMGQAIANQIPR